MYVYESYIGLDGEWVHDVNPQFCFYGFKTFCLSIGVISLTV